MIHNVNVYRSTGGHRNLRRMVFAPDDPFNLPDDSFVVHAQSYFDQTGDYLEVWIAVPTDSELLRTNTTVGVSDAPDTMYREDEDEAFEDDPILRA